MNQNDILAFGIGSNKSINIIKNPRYNVLHHDYEPSAKNMIENSYKKYLNKEFENIAYFEPYYLKEFYNSSSKENLIWLSR